MCSRAAPGHSVLPQGSADALSHPAITHQCHHFQPLFTLTRPLALQLQKHVFAATVRSSHISFLYWKNLRLFVRVCIRFCLMGNFWRAHIPAKPRFKWNIRLRTSAPSYVEAELQRALFEAATGSSQRGLGHESRRLHLTMDFKQHHHCMLYDFDRRLRMLPILFPTMVPCMTSISLD